MEKPATTSQPIHDLLARRWSPRAFESRDLTREQVTALLEAARWAPSCFGDQPWRYLVWQRSVDGTGWEQAFGCLTPANQLWVKPVPLLLLACADSQFTHNGKPNRWGPYDTGAASENICLQALALGLAAHQMGGFDVVKVKELFHIPETFTPMAMIAIGYAGNADTLPDPGQREKEQQPRVRRALGEVAFSGSWGRPLENS